MGRTITSADRLNTQYKGAYRTPVQTGIFHGVKRTLWIEYDAKGQNIASYWADDTTSRKVGVHN